MLSTLFQDRIECFWFLFPAGRRYDGYDAMKTHTLLLVLVLGLLVVGGVQAQAQNGITSPRDNAVVRGVVVIEGTATSSSFMRYEIAFFKEFDPLGDWVVFATESREVINGALATWDTTIGRNTGSPVFPDGTYRLRLRVVRQDSNYDEYYVMGISVANEQVTATAAPSPTLPPDVSPSPPPTVEFALPTELPTLTPFPSVTPRPTTEGDQPTPVGRATPTRSGSPLRFEGEISGAQIRAGFCWGVYATIAFFLALAAYLVFRKSIRHAALQLRAWVASRRK